MCVARGRLVGVAIVVGVAGVCLALPALAGATASWVWGGGWRVSETGLDALQCPSKSLCVGVAGNEVVSSERPTGGPSAWKSVSLAPLPGNDDPAVIGLSCPSASLCVAAYANGDIRTSTDPSGPRSAWSLAEVDSGPVSPWLHGISCPATSLCVAVDDAGNVVTSIDPAGGAQAWTVTHVDNQVESECLK